MSGRSVILCGARSGRFPLEMLAAEPDCALTVHAYDAYQAHAIREDLNAAGATGVEILCAARLPAGRAWDAGRFVDDPKTFSAELKLDCLQDLFAHVKGGRSAVVAGVDKATRRQVLERVRSFASEWTASVPGGEPLVFTSHPGCFCHRRADAGGLALAEVAAREVADGCAGRTVRILDMGCGCGFVGILVADAVRRAGGDARVTFVDSHTRAIESARENAARAGFEAGFVLSHAGAPADVACDVFLGNPPYYGDWSIAETFLSTAARALRSGGRCYSVAKRAEGLMRVQSAFFPSVRVVPRRGYAVLASAVPPAGTGRRNA